MALAVDIIDNGPGVPVDMQEKIFYPLVTGRAEGSGLGTQSGPDLREAGGWYDHARERSRADRLPSAAAVFAVLTVPDLRKNSSSEREKSYG